MIKKSLLAAGLISAMGLAIWASIRNEDQRLVTLKEQVGTGQAAIGGDFTLVDQFGKTRTNHDFPGKYLMIYFGYSYCPDICPMGLQAMTAALEQIGPLANRIQPLFITVDPKRDTVKNLKVYMENFDPRFLGLTGSQAQVDTAVSAYKVYASPHQAEDSTDYVVDHSSIVYIMDPKGVYVGHFTHATPPAEMAEKLKELVR